MASALRAALNVSVCTPYSRSASSNTSLPARGGGRHQGGLPRLGLAGQATRLAAGRDGLAAPGERPARWPPQPPPRAPHPSARQWSL